MAEFVLQTLGFPEIQCHSGPSKLNLRKGLALLIYLAEARGPVARDVIAALLWPRAPAKRPAHGCGACFIALSLCWVSAFSKLTAPACGGLRRSN